MAAVLIGYPQTSAKSMDQRPSTAPVMRNSNLQQPPGTFRPYAL
jgi:hypothetical protein